MRPWRPRLRTILILINLVILVLPLGGIAVLRIYESALIRQTESELLAQAAFIATAYESALDRSLRQSGAKKNEPYGLPVAAPAAHPENGRWHPHFAQLDLALDPVLPPPPEAQAPAAPADAAARRAGEELVPMLIKVQQQTLAGFSVVDPQGVVVAATNLPLGVSIVNHEEVRQALAGETVSLLRQRVLSSDPPPLESISRGARIRVFVAAPVWLHDRVAGAVLLVRTPGNIKQALRGKQRELLTGGALLLALALALTLFSSVTISRPLRALVEQARRGARGEAGAVAPLAQPGTHEIAELSATIAQMARALEARAAYIRDLATHVSHEFKTPLTAIQGSAELLRDHGEEMSAAEREKFLRMIGEDALRLEKLVRRLLELARADMTAPAQERSELRAVLDGVLARYRERGLEVSAADCPDCGVRIAADTLDSILSNLLDNARVHGARADGSTPKVRLNAEVHGGKVLIHVEDNGSGISPANAARIFEPFFTTARDRGSTGLGLVIVRALLLAYGGSIVLTPSASGAHFIVTLPQCS